MKNQKGFTLIELVVVVVILGFLAITAIPKFVDLTQQAKQANIQGLAGGFATGVSLARAQWEVEARETQNDFNVTNYDGTLLFLTTPADPDGVIRPGYPVGLSNTSAIDADMTATTCTEVWNNILSQPPSISNDIDDLNANNGAQYFVDVLAGDGIANNAICIYFLKESLDRDNNGDYETPADETVGNNFTYDPANSAVVININDL
jgi:MSHA pilin protein MshB